MNKINILLIIIIIVFIFLIFHPYLETIYKFETFDTAIAEFPEGSPEDRLDDDDLNNFNSDDNDNNDDDDDDNSIDENFEIIDSKNFFNEMLTQLLGFDIFETFVAKPAYRGTSYGGRANCPVGCRGHSSRRRKRASRRRKEGRSFHHAYHHNYNAYDAGYRAYLTQLAAYNAEQKRIKAEAAAKAAAELKRKTEQLNTNKTTFDNAKTENRKLWTNSDTYYNTPQNSTVRSNVLRSAGDKFNLTFNGVKVGNGINHPWHGPNFAGPKFNEDRINQYYPTLDRVLKADYNSDAALNYLNEQRIKRIQENQQKTKDGKERYVREYADYNLGTVYSKNLGNIKAMAGAKPEIRNRNGGISQHPVAPHDLKKEILGPSYFKNGLTAAEWNNNYMNKVNNTVARINTLNTDRKNALDKEQKRLTQIQRANDIKAANDSTKLANQQINKTAELKEIQKKIFKEYQDKLKLREQQFSKLRKEETKKMKSHFYNVERKNARTASKSNKTRNHGIWFNSQTYQGHNEANALAKNAVDSTRDTANNFDSVETDNIKSLALNVRSNL